MDRQREAGVLWRLAALGLVVCAVPLAWQWRSSESAAPPDGVRVDSDGAVWTGTDTIAIQLRPGTSGDSLANLAVRAGYPIVWNSPLAQETGVARLPLPPGVPAQAILTALRGEPQVEAADLAHFYRIPEASSEMRPVAMLPQQTPPEDSLWKPNDPRYAEQWNFRKVHAEQAWTVSRGKGAVVAVIDTGVAYATNKKGKRARDFGGTRFVRGYDFVNRDEYPNDDHGHGTHVAGTIAETTDNGEGVAGLAFEAAIMPIKVLNARGGGWAADIAEGIRWAADHGANVINMSLGSPVPDQLMRSACEYAHKKGVVIVCAAGNSGREGVGYPAAYKECIAVSATGPDDELSFYSSWGRQITLAAPGGDKMKGGDAGGILQNSVITDESGAVVDDYYSWQGTSMASPHVAAVAALIVARGVRDPEEVRGILQKSARKKGPTDKYGAGILDAASAARMSVNTYEDGVTRFWLVAGLFAGCYTIGRLRLRSLRGGRPLPGAPEIYPFWSTAALAFGLLFPDWLVGFLGGASHWNLIGHSVIIPGALLLYGASDVRERRMAGWMACGMALHVGWEALRGTVPPGVSLDTWAVLPWIAINVLAGGGILLAGLARRR